tara:strand:- start:1773 stop:2834 length:1062 start_codon:yes stop_codon:yes gene_type:complete
MIEPIEWSKIFLAEPLWLTLLLCIPFLAWLHAKEKIRIPTLHFSSLAKIKETKNHSPKSVYRLPRLLRILSIIFLILALCRPQVDQSTETIRSSGVDIVLAIDLSASMLALDMSDAEQGEVTRLDVVKDVIKEFIDKRAHDRLGLVAFSVNPYLVSALTLDKEYLHQNLDRLKVGLTHQTGTNIGSALAEGINRLRPLESKSKILILLTDGKDEPTPPHSPLIYADGALKDNIKIYTIAIGSNRRTRTYLFDPSSRDLMRYANGNPVVQVADYPVDKAILKKISEKTQALFFEAKDKQSLSSIYSEIDRLEKTDVQLNVNALFEDLYQWPLGLAAFLLIIEIFLTRTIFLRIP